MELWCLDLEGFWFRKSGSTSPSVAGIEALRLTTRDIPDYDQRCGGGWGCWTSTGLNYPISSG